MDCLSVITSRGNNCVPNSNSGINVNSKLNQTFGCHTAASDVHLRSFGCRISQNGFTDHGSGFGANSVMADGFGVPSHNRFHPGYHQRFGKYPALMTGNGFSIPCSTPLGSRKRSLDDDDDSDECKRQRIGGDYEASMLAYNGGFPLVQNQVMIPGNNFNTSSMEHQTTVAATRGYEDMYMYDIMISQLHGC